jgi:putative oxidoreductase
MKKLMSIQYNPLAFNTSMLLLRLTLGILMMAHGYDKLIHLNEYKATFLNFLGIGSTGSLLLVVFAEFFCALFIVIGLFTRIVTIPLIITMAVVVFQVHILDFFGKAELGSLYLTGYLVLLMCGPGKVSIDGIAGK